MLCQCGVPSPLSLPNGVPRPVAAPYPTVVGRMTTSIDLAGAAPVAAAGQKSPAQRLLGVKNLLDQGLITQAEYDVKRAAIIDEVASGT